MARLAIDRGLCTPTQSTSSPLSGYSFSHFQNLPAHPGIRHALHLPSMAEYEELRACVIAGTAQTHEALTPPGQSHTPIGPERDMNTENNQDPSSNSGQLQNDGNSAMAEFDRIAAAYNTTPSVVSDARTFAQVRTPRFPLRIIL
jgi:hypothetical protein